MSDQLKTKVTLSVKTRRKKEKVSYPFMIPAILYGPSFKNKMLWVNRNDFKKVYEKVGDSTIFDLIIKNENQKEKKESVLIFEIQNDPISDEIIHIDFYKVKMDEEITTEVELEFVGESPAVKELGGVLVKNMNEVKVTCFPKDLPSVIQIDISSLKTFDDYIYVKDIKISPKVKIEIDPETVIALVSPPRSDEEIKALDQKVEVDMSKIEKVETKKEEINSNT